MYRTHKNGYVYSQGNECRGGAQPLSGRSARIHPVGLEKVFAAKVHPDRTAAAEAPVRLKCSGFQRQSYGDVLCHPVGVFCNAGACTQQTSIQKTRECAWAALKSNFVNMRL